MIDTNAEKEELLRYLEEHNKKGLDSGEDIEGYSYLLALEFAKVLQKDLEAFKKLTPEEQEKVFWEYHKEMEALSDEELEERYEKFF